MKELKAMFEDLIRKGESEKVPEIIGILQKPIDPRQKEDLIDKILDEPVSMVEKTASSAASRNRHKAQLKDYVANYMNCCPEKYRMHNMVKSR